MSAAHPARYRDSAMPVSVYWVAVRANSSVSAISSSTAITACPAQPLSRVLAGGSRRLPAGVRHRGTRRRWQGPAHRLPVLESLVSGALRGAQSRAPKPGQDAVDSRHASASGPPGSGSRRVAATRPSRIAAASASVAKTCAIAISLRSPSVIRAVVSARDRASSVSVTNRS